MHEVIFLFCSAISGQLLIMRVIDVCLVMPIFTNIYMWPPEGSISLMKSQYSSLQHVHVKCPKSPIHSSIFYHLPYAVSQSPYLQRL